MTRRRRGVLAAVATAMLALLLGGCELLMGSAFGPGFGPTGSSDFEEPFPSFEAPFPSPSQIAVYTQGSATIRISGAGTTAETIELTRFYAGSTADSFYGAQAHWGGPDGWHLRVSGVGGDEPVEFGGYLVFDRITDGEHWTSLGDDDSCDLHVTAVTAVAFRGTATCKGVHWFDELSAMDGPDPPTPLDQPAFDAEVTFEARP